MKWRPEMDAREIRAELVPRVKQGMAFLDEHKPGWVEEIDLGRFDIDDGCRCVLGQIFEEEAAGDGGYAGYTYACHKVWPEVLNGHDKPSQYGFSIEPGRYINANDDRYQQLAWQVLDEIWIEEIGRRQRQVVEQPVEAAVNKTVPAVKTVPAKAVLKVRR